MLAGTTETVVGLQSPK